MAPPAKSAGNWEQVRGPDYLWGDEMAGRLTKALQERNDDGADRAAAQAAVTAKLVQLGPQTHAQIPEADARKLGKNAEAIIGAIAAEEAPPGDAQAPFALEAIPTARSCVSGFGPYNQWGFQTVTQTLGTWQRQVIATIPTTTPRVLHPSLSIVEAWGGAQLDALRGAGCWFTVARSGVATLTAEFFFNAHNNVFGGA